MFKVFIGRGTRLGVALALAAAPLLADAQDCDFSKDLFRFLVTDNFVANCKEDVRSKNMAANHVWLAKKTTLLRWGEVSDSFSPYKEVFERLSGGVIYVIPEPAEDMFKTDGLWRRKEREGEKKSERGYVPGCSVESAVDVRSLTPYGGDLMKALVNRSLTFVAPHAEFGQAMYFAGYHFFFGEHGVAYQRREAVSTYTVENNVVCVANAHLSRCFQAMQAADGQAYLVRQDGTLAGLALKLTSSFPGDHFGMALIKQYDLRAAELK